MIVLIVTLTVGLALVIDDQVARDVAARWAARIRGDLGMTSTARDEGWLRVTAAVTTGAGGRGVADEAEAYLLDELHRVGHQVTAWHAVEVLTDDEHTRRARNRGMPRLVGAADFARLLGVSRQRVYQLEAKRKAGERADFPAPVLDGHWLAAEAEHYVNRVRRTASGPVPRASS